MNEKGLTLSQLVLLIVVMLVVVLVIVPRIFNYIVNSENVSFISNAQFYVDEVRKRLTLTEGFPVDQNATVTYPISELDLDQKKKKSVYGNPWVDEKCYVVTKNIGTMESPKYSYSIALQDEKGYCMELTDEANLKKADVKTEGCQIPNFSEVAAND